MREKIPYWTIVLLTLAGLALVVIPNGMRFTGFLFLGSAALWLSGAFLRRWARDSRMGRLFWRAFLMGTALVLALFNGHRRPRWSFGERRTTPAFRWTR